MTRVAVFIDYQNSYHCAREAFGDPRMDPPQTGHVYPLRLGRLLVDLGKPVDSKRVLTEVQVFRGLPGSKGHRNVIAASARQVNAWKRQERVIVNTRPLKYRKVVDGRGGTHWKGEEKGIDVMMALSVAVGALKDTYDVAIVVSSDTDLTPAIETALGADKRVETSTWRGPRAANKSLRVPGQSLWNHELRQDHFERVRDDTDYLARPDDSGT